MWLYESTLEVNIKWLKAYSGWKYNCIFSLHPMVSGRMLYFIKGRYNGIWIHSHGLLSFKSLCQFSNSISHYYDKLRVFRSWELVYSGLSSHLPLLPDIPTSDYHLPVTVSVNYIKIHTVSQTRKLGTILKFSFLCFDCIQSNIKLHWFAF